MVEEMTARVESLEKMRIGSVNIHPFFASDVHLGVHLA